jgi:hypothetical protein
VTIQILPGEEEVRFGAGLIGSATMLEEGHRPDPANFDNRAGDTPAATFKTDARVRAARVGCGAPYSMVRTERS